MTVCIAALCVVGDEPAIVLCADTRGSSPLGSRERLVKAALLVTEGHWYSLGAGSEDEILALTPILRRQLFALSPTINETNVMQAIRLALTDRKNEKTNEFTQGRWGLTYEEFRRSKVEFPETQFRSDMLEISQIALDADLLISGFLECGLPMLLQTDSKGTVKIREDWAVVGEGAYLAQSVLMHRDHYETFPLEKTLYCVYEAKRYAERVSSVGVETNLAIYRAGHPPQMVTANGLEYLEAQFAKYGPQELPDTPIELKPDFLKSLARSEPSTA